MKICMSFKSMEPPTSSYYSISLTTIYGFWLSQTGHSKLSYSVPVLSNFFKFTTFISLHTSFSHLIVRFPLVSILLFFFTNNKEFIFCMWPNHPILWALKILWCLLHQSNNPAKHYFNILQVYSPVHSGANIFFKICLSNIPILLLSCSLTVHISEAYVTTGLIRVCYSF